MNHKFDGFDYTEIFEKWNLCLPEDYESEENTINLLMKDLFYMMFFKYYNHYENKPARVGKEFCKDCRNYCKVMIENYYDWHNDSSLWKGLIEIKDDWTFMRYFQILIGFAWS